MGGSFINYFSRFGRQWRVFLEAEGEQRTRAHLHAVGILGHQVYVAFRHHLGYDGQARFTARAGQQLEAFKTEPLK